MFVHHPAENGDRVVTLILQKQDLGQTFEAIIASHR
jgi:hypothetical protein